MLIRLNGPALRESRIGRGFAPGCEKTVSPCNIFLPSRNSCETWTKPVWPRRFFSGGIGNRSRLANVKTPSLPRSSWATATGFSTLDAAGIRTAVGMASADLDTQLDAIKADTAATLTDTAEIGAAGAGLTALATAANLATVDTVVDAIKVKTDSLAFTVAGQVDANIQYVNDVALVGDGSATPWGPA